MSSEFNLSRPEGNAGLILRQGRTAGGCENAEYGPGDGRKVAARCVKFFFLTALKSLSDFICKNFEND
jgi:hypothetical protein